MYGHTVRLLSLYCFLTASFVSSFDANRLQVITAVDTSSASVVRDSYTFFRSVRLFGGTFNDAAFKACILLKDTTPTPPHVDSHLIETLTALNISYTFRYRVSDEVSPTLNKFIAFELFDINSFDYLLWLDADIFVFQDPIAALNAAVSQILDDISLSGKPRAAVYCTTEMYNFLERFPAINESDSLWNRRLESFVVHDVTANGETRVVPYGTCNTGVLLFTSAGYALFMEQLPPHTVYDHYGVPEYSRDRFIDSLLFVSAVNKAELQVYSLDYSLNYMAFINTMHLYSSNPILAHFIGSTYLYCFPQIGHQSSPVATDGTDAESRSLPLCSSSSDDVDRERNCLGCSCMYYEENHELSAHIVRMIKEKKVLEKCYELAGLIPIRKS